MYRLLKTLALAALSLALFLIALQGARANWYEATHWEQATGVIIVGPTYDGEPTNYLIGFRKRTGEAVRFRQTTMGYQERPGALLPVLYDPMDAQHARIATISSLWIEPLMFFLCALAAGIGAVFVAVSRAPRPREASRRPRPIA